MLPALWLLFVFTGTTACKNNERSSRTHEDSLKLVMMQARLDSMERALAAKEQTASETVMEGSEGGGINAGKNKSSKRFKESVRKVPRAGKGFFAKDRGNYPEGSNRLLTEKDVQHLSPWGYKLMLHEIYARHGMSFSDKELQEHFNNQDWYRTGRKNVDESLSETEKRNIEFLKNHPK